MQEIKFEVKLRSDAELGSGMGDQLVNGLLARDHQGRPVLRASHIKGVMRDRLAGIALPLFGQGEAERAEALEEAVFGREGREGDEGAPSRVQLTDLPFNGAALPLTVTRTALGELGTVAATSLRTDEALPCGATLRGTMRLDAEPDSVVDLAARLALLAVEAVGGSRNRGCGACRMAIEGEARSPGAVLRDLAARVEAEGIPGPAAVTAPAEPSALQPDQDAVWLRLIFRAASPVCCPESPVVGNNTIQAGLQIPASAVQGAILHRLSRMDDGLASACYADRRFRAWPLLPAAPDAFEGQVPAPVACSLTHKMSKLPDEHDHHDFEDATIQPYDWRKVAAGSPLKATGGVLLRDTEGGVSVWRSADIPRALSAHGVHRDGTGQRNLFTIEAIAPLTWSGLVALPREAAVALTESLTEDPHAAFGKARSVRGAGLLEAVKLTPADLAPPPLDQDMAGRVFVVQSPLRIDDEAASGSCEETLAAMVRAAGWGAVQECHGAAGVRFGWNRHGLGDRGQEGNRLRAVRCILPGSVVVLEQPLEDLPSQLLTGVGGGRGQGFGGLLPHPGVAGKLNLPGVSMIKLGSTNAAGRKGLELYRMAPGGQGPAPAAISGLAGRLARDRDAALDHLKRQLQRSERFYRVWKRVASDVETLILQSTDADHRAFALDALRVWQDLAVANREADKEGR